MPLFGRKKRSRLREIGEAEAYGRTYGETGNDVRIVKVEPRRRRYDLDVSGEQLRDAFAKRLDSRDGDAHRARD